MKFARIHWPAIGGALISAVGILARPEILNLMPAKPAAVIGAAGLLIQAFTKPAKK